MLLLSYVCDHCQCTFTLPAAHQRRGAHIYCSRACYHQHRQRPPAERFWAKVLKTDGCWLWQGNLYSNGYGDFTIGTQHLLAHRFSFELAYGMLLPGMQACHHCDVRACIRPDHMFVGNHSINALDMTRKGRNGAHTHPEKLRRGSMNSAAKLTEAQVIEIRQRFATGQWTKAALARAFMVSEALIYSIVHRQVWRHVA